MSVVLYGGRRTATPGCLCCKYLLQDMDRKVETQIVVKLETLETDDDLTAGMRGFLAHTSVYCYTCCLCEQWNSILYLVN